MRTDRRCRFRAISFLVIASFIPLSVSHASEPLLLVETWRIKPGNGQPHDYWIQGVVKNISGQRLADLYVVFAVKTASGKLLGECKAELKLTTLLPDQECPYAAQVCVHDRRMYKIVLTDVKAGMVGDVVMLGSLPFTAQQRSAFFAGVRREDGKRIR